jgi:hypothetical protein
LIYDKSIRVGYSKKITDPAFKRYIQQSKRWSLIFSLILAVVAVAGFFIYGERSVDMENPQALYIGLAVGSMFVLIALLQNLSRKRSKTWDGIVIDKRIERKTRKNKTDEIEDFILFTIVIRSNSSKIHEITAEDDNTLYNYYKIGDKVRHHAGLNTFEKYDKSKDSIIFCNACAYLNDIEDDYCYRCKCPLLK